MTISETVFSFLKEDLIKEFGPRKGAELYGAAERIYRELTEGADDRGSEVIGEHLRQKIFPPMAYYKALLADGAGSDEAIAYVKKETRKNAARKRDEMRRLARMPFAYGIYRMGVKKYLRKNFPDEGWETEWKSCGKKEIHFDFHRCLYWDMAVLHGCPELCCVYCENDDIAFSGLLPKIRFERSGTLGEGSSCCDFHFVKS